MVAACGRQVRLTHILDSMTHLVQIFVDFVAYHTAIQYSRHLQLEANLSPFEESGSFPALIMEAGQSRISSGLDLGDQADQNVE